MLYGKSFVDVHWPGHNLRINANAPKTKTPYDLAENGALYFPRGILSEASSDAERPLRRYAMMTASQLFPAKTR